MADLVETILMDAAEIANVIAWVVPEAAPIAKIIGYAAEAEPEAVKVLDMISAHKVTGAATLMPEHYIAIGNAISAIELRHAQQGRGGR